MAGPGATGKLRLHTQVEVLKLVQVQGLVLLGWAHAARRRSVEQSHGPLEDGGPIVALCYVFVFRNVPVVLTTTVRGLLHDGSNCIDLGRREWPHRHEVAQVIPPGVMVDTPCTNVACCRWCRLPTSCPFGILSSPHLSAGRRTAPVVPRRDCRGACCTPAQPCPWAACVNSRP